jgi:hypothetical protein
MVTFEGIFEPRPWMISSTRSGSKRFPDQERSLSRRMSHQQTDNGSYSRIMKASGSSSGNGTSTLPVAERVLPSSKAEARSIALKMGETRVICFEDTSMWISPSQLFSLVRFKIKVRSPSGSKIFVAVEETMVMLMILSRGRCANYACGTEEGQTSLVRW